MRERGRQLANKMKRAPVINTGHDNVDVAQDALDRGCCAEGGGLLMFGCERVNGAGCSCSRSWLPEETRGESALAGGRQTWKG
jgi:hypothetical protein